MLYIFRMWISQKSTFRHEQIEVAFGNSQIQVGDSHNQALDRESSRKELMGL